MACSRPAGRAVLPTAATARPAGREDGLVSLAARDNSRGSDRPGRCSAGVPAGAGNRSERAYAASTLFCTTWASVASTTSRGWFVCPAAQSRNDDRKPCGTAPILLRAEHRPDPGARVVVPVVHATAHSMTVLIRWRTRRTVAGRSCQTARSASTTSAPSFGCRWAARRGTRSSPSQDREVVVIVYYSAVYGCIRTHRAALALVVWWTRLPKRRAFKTL